MAPNKIDLNNQKELAIYKILNDILFLLLIILSLVLFTEAILPGFVSGYLSFTKIIISVFAVLAAIGYLGKKNHIEYASENKKPLHKNKRLIFFIVFSAILTTASMFGMNWMETIAISFGMFFTVFYIYRALFYLQD